MSNLCPKHGKQLLSISRNVLQSFIVFFNYVPIYTVLFSGVWARKCVCSKTYCPENHVNFTCETEGNCFSQIKKDEHTDDIIENYGCLPKEPSDTVSIFQCKGNSQRKSAEHNSVSCCSDRDFCNENLKPTFRTTENKPSEC